MVLALAAVLGGGAAAHTGWKNAPSGQLAWDGEVWRWESSGYQTGVAEYELSVIADFQHRLLLRLENPADRKSTRLNSSHIQKSRMPSSA